MKRLLLMFCYFIVGVALSLVGLNLKNWQVYVVIGALVAVQTIEHFLN